MSLPPFSELSKYAAGGDLAPERFYMTEAHQKCADWKLSISIEGPDAAPTVIVLPGHSQVLAGASPVFAEMAGESMKCNAPVELGLFGLKAVLGALRLAYKPDVVSESTARILLEEKAFAQVLQIGDKFDFCFYDPIVKLTTPELLASVSYSAVTAAAGYVFDHDIEALKPLFLAAISTFMSYLQLSRDTDAISRAVAELSASPALMAQALSESLMAPSRGQPHPMFSFCENDSQRIKDLPPALFTFHFSKVDGLGKSSSINSPHFNFKGYKIYLNVKMDVDDKDADKPDSGEKCLAAYLHLSGPPGTILKAKGIMRLINLRDPTSSRDRTLGPHEFGTTGWGYHNLAPMADAMLPTVWGSLGVAQVVSIEKVDNVEQVNDAEN